MRPGSVLLALVLALGACSTDPDEVADPDLAGTALNPDGAPYPTDNLGGRTRAGQRRGDRIPNLTFRAYRDPANPAAGLQSFSLAELYDPQQRRHKVLHIQVAATWCAICSGELSQTVPVAEALRAEGAVRLEVIISGQTSGAGPAESEVEAWMARHRTNLTTAVDVRGRRLAALGVSTAVVPHDILVDTRTMEILDSSVGSPLDVAKYVRDGLRFANTSAPSY